VYTSVTLPTLAPIILFIDNMTRFLGYAAFT